MKTVASIKAVFDGDHRKPYDPLLFATRFINQPASLRSVSPTDFDVLQSESKCLTKLRPSERRAHPHRVDLSLPRR